MFSFNKPIKKQSCDNDQKKQEPSCFELSRDADQIRKHHVTVTKKEPYISNNLQHQSHSLTFFFKNISILPVSSVLSQQAKPVAYNTTASLGKLTCTIYVDFWKVPGHIC